MVGYALSIKGYRIWLPETNKVVETINVLFNKEATYEQHNRAELGSTNTHNKQENNIDSFGDKEESALHVLYVNQKQEKKH